jgi:hypothetical protein
MSKGGGRIQRAIGAIFDAEPDNAFTVEELCRRIYPGIDHYERSVIHQKYRVSVICAAKKLCERRPELAGERSDGTLGRTLVFYRRDNLMSYAMFRLKAEGFYHYRSNDRREERWRTEEADLRKILDDDKYRERMAPGGAWWRHTQMFFAERDGDTERLAQLKAVEEAALDVLWAGVRSPCTTRNTSKDRRGSVGPHAGSGARLPKLGEVTQGDMGCDGEARREPA